jgi:hypothetical protein
MNSEPSAIDRLTSKPLLEVYGTWMKAAAGRMAPRRDEITPALLKSVLPWVWMIDVVDGGTDFRFRIAGDRVIQFMGRRYAGQLLSEFAGQPFFEVMREILLASLTSKRPLVSGPTRSSLPGKEHLALQVAVLPLSEDGLNVTTIFGAMEITPAGSQKLPKGQP